MKLLFGLVVVLLLVFILWRIDVMRSVNLVKYEDVAIGMTRAQVDEVMGFEGEELSRKTGEAVGGRPAITTTIYAWKNRSGAGMNGIFENDVLTQKWHYGFDEEARP